MKSSRMGSKTGVVPVLAKQTWTHLSRIKNMPWLLHTWMLKMVEKCHKDAKIGGMFEATNEVRRMTATMI